MFMELPKTVFPRMQRKHLEWIKACKMRCIVAQKKKKEEIRSTYFLHLFCLKMILLKEVQYGFFFFFFGPCDRKKRSTQAEIHLVQ